MNKNEIIEDLEDLIVEFDEMDYTPLTLCENYKKEISQFKERLTKILLYLKSDS